MRDTAVAVAARESANGGLPRAVIPPMNFAGSAGAATAGDFELSAAPLRPEPQRFQFESGIGTLSDESAAELPRFREAARSFARQRGADSLASAESLSELKPLGQMSSSFIVAVNGEGLWIIDQHVAHERVLFEQHLRARRAGQLTGQRMLVPLMVELSPRQLSFSSGRRGTPANGFEADLMGTRSIAIHAAPQASPPPMPKSS